MAKVFVGLSGGVDSAVAAALLKADGHQVTGVHMQNWTTDIAGFECPWKEDYQEAKRVAAHLDIDFKLYDFQTEYKQMVVDAMIDEFRIGKTPNPDVMCNQEVKFKVFLDRCLADGAEFIATGHYAKTVGDRLYMASDSNKDQTYFLYRMTAQACSKTLFPLTDLTKPQVRQLALDYSLPNASRKESMGICFVGKVGIKDFLKEYVTTEPGPIMDEAGQLVGDHEGAIFYTIGQRHGLNVGGGLPYYVTSKDMDSNTVYVTRDINSDRLWKDRVGLTSLHWINDAPTEGKEYQVRTRHRADLVAARLTLNEVNAELIFNNPQKALTPGQSAVLYEGSRVVGGGLIS